MPQVSVLICQLNQYRSSCTTDCVLCICLLKAFAQGAVAKDEKINIVVPTGNFGNILAAFYAKNMGLPVAKLICASNENKVLYDFFTTGEYDKNREFILTNSPSMDILISSNLERLIYRIAGNDANKNAQLMASLAKDGKYTVTPEMKEELSDFYGNYTSEKETAEVIKKLYEDTGYIIDTHTAVAAGVYDKYKELQVIQPQRQLSHLQQARSNSQEV
mgnify:CR=1 FL=1